MDINEFREYYINEIKAAALNNNTHPIHEFNNDVKQHEFKNKILHIEF